MCREWNDNEIRADEEAEYLEATQDVPEKFEPTDAELEDMNQVWLEIKTHTKKYIN